jgi:hypothetical protein
MMADDEYMSDSMLGQAASYLRRLLDAILLKMKGLEKEVLALRLAGIFQYQEALNLRSARAIVGWYLLMPVGL